MKEKIILTNTEKFKLAIELSQTLLDNNIVDIEKPTGNPELPKTTSKFLKNIYFGIDEAITDINNL
jgi:hypothetical protein